MANDACCCRPDGTLYYGQGPKPDPWTYGEMIDWCRVVDAEGNLVEGCPTGKFSNCTIDPAPCDHARCGCCRLDLDGTSMCEDLTPVGLPWDIQGCLDVDPGSTLPVCARCITPNNTGCDLDAEEPTACCFDTGECLDLASKECAQAGGAIDPSGLCSQVDCGPDLNCRYANLHPQPAQAAAYTYPVENCDTAVFEILDRQRPDGVLELASAHKVMNRFTKAGIDPCHYAIGELHSDPDGFVYPLTCSQPEAPDASARWNRGYFTSQPETDPVDRVEEGMVHARIGIEPPPAANLLLFHNWLPCGGAL